ncbi:MAG: AraC family transcriptional regulator [bacterium]|nr:AraC family transcriptional regulator [bacterium]
MRMYVKNMVCDRCKAAVADAARKLDLRPRSVELGEIDFGEDTPKPGQIAQLETQLVALGFEIIDDKNGRLIESMKRLVIALVRDADEFRRVRLSDYLKQNLHYDYSYLSGIFSSVEGLTLEQYLIQQKIERVKELLVYDEMNLTEIAHRLGYSSLAHLSAQFKKVTGLTPSHFRNLKDTKQRKPLDQL